MSTLAFLLHHRQEVDAFLKLIILHACFTRPHQLSLNEGGTFGIWKSDTSVGGIVESVSWRKRIRSTFVSTIRREVRY